MDDVIVVIPGIMGSTLIAADGQELWGVKPGTLLRSVRQLGSNFEKFRLPPGIGDNPAPDGVRAGELIPIPHVVGKLLGSDGYGHLIAWLENTFDVRQPRDGKAGNLIPFPYDWRLSNRVNAKRIEMELVPLLEQWRKKNPEAKFRFICHSMGGLVARWFTEVLGGRELTRQVITIGTPHRGAAAALVHLSNGFDPGFGPIRIPLTEILRSLPSAHQLLPTYKCVDTADGYKRLGEVTIPDVDETMLKDAIAFHTSIHEHAKTQPPESYETFALKGISQPTTTIVQIRNGRLDPLKHQEGNDWNWSGDGTVPRISSHMPEWRNDAHAAVFGQQHSTLQSDGNLHRQLFAILTASEIETLADAERIIGLDLPEVVQAGEPLAITVTSASGDATLPLRAKVFGEDGSEVDSSLMRNLGKGRYQAQFEDIPPGQVKVRIANATRAVPLDPVTGVTIVWDPDLDGEDA